MKAAAAQQQQPPVADQVMAAADQEALAGLPTGMPQQYATGGIVAFAEGDLVDDEDEEDYRDALIEAELMKVSKMRPDSFATVNKTPATGLGYGNVQGQQMNADKTQYTGGGIYALIGSAAEKHGVPVALAQNIARAEAGGTMNMKGDPRSTAKGPFGMLESTWLGMGGTRENRADPEANADIGTKLIRSNAESLKKSLGRNPTYGEVYAAHHFGSGVSKMLKNADPKESIEQGLSMFESPKRVNQIMAANPHLKGQTVGSVMAMMDKKGGQGIVDMADGGIAVLPNNAVNSMNMAGGGIARFAEKGYVDIGGKQYETTDDPDYVLVNGLKTKRNVIEQSALSPWNASSSLAANATTSTPETPLGRWWDKINAGSEDYVKRENRRAELGPSAGLLGALKPQSQADYDAANRERSELSSPTTVRAPTPKPGQPLPGRTIGPDSPQPAPTQEQMGKGTPESNRSLMNAAGEKGYPYVAPVQAPPVGGGKGDGQEGGGSQTPPPVADNPFDKLIAGLDEERKQRGARADQDRWMGLLTAGLGMMGGTSPNAMVNIGQGAMYGAQQYQQARKQSAAEAAAADKAYATAVRYKDLGDYYKEKMNLTEDQRKAEIGQKEYIAASNVMKSMYENRVDQAKAIYGKPELWDDETRKKAMDFINEVKKDQRYIDAERRIGSLQGYEVIRQRPAA